MVAPGTTAMLLPTVQKWRTSGLNDFAAALTTANNHIFEVNIDETKKFFTDAATHWQGAAYDAAYDRVAEDHQQARKVWGYIDELAGALRSAASDIESHRGILLGKVGDAQAAGLRVADNWVVCEAEGISADVIQSHQDAINGALWPFFDSVTTAGTKISEAAEFVRIAGDLFGSDLDVDDTKTQGGRIGAEDGRAAADAARDHDTAKLDEIASHLPTHVLTPEQIAALSNGQDVPTLPAEVQDYYKEFFASAGKDGLLALNDRLDAQAAGSPTNPATAAAVAQQRALADGMLAVTNDHLGTGIGPDGKLTSPGQYTNLPPDVRQLISGREQEYVGNSSSPSAVADRMRQRTKLADLLSHADPGMQGGRTFSTEIGRQAQSMAAYLDSSGGQLPSSFTDADKKAMETAAQQFLGTATRNHEADYQLLTGLDPYTGQKIPDDLSFGARGSEYGTHGEYDPDKFADTVFRNHTWADKGSAAAGLYEWAGQHTHDPDAAVEGTQGNLARKTVTELPHVLAPTKGDSLEFGADRKSIFQHTADSFNKNPELANSLSRVMAGNLDSVAEAGDPLVSRDPNTAVHMDLKDSERLLMLADQTDEGRKTLGIAKETYDNAVAYQLTHGGIPPEDQQAVVRRMAALDAHIDNSAYNAQAYQRGDEIAKHNDQAQKDYKDTKEIADSVKKIVDAVPVPGGAVVKPIKDILEDQAYKAVMKEVNPTPRPELLQFEYSEHVANDGTRAFYDRINSFQQASGHQVYQGQIDNMNAWYAQTYGNIVDEYLVKNSSDLEQLSTGGKQAPKSGSGVQAGN